MWEFCKLDTYVTDKPYTFIRIIISTETMWSGRIELYTEKYFLKISIQNLIHGIWNKFNIFEIHFLSVFVILYYSYNDFRMYLCLSKYFSNGFKINICTEKWRKSTKQILFHIIILLTETSFYDQQISISKIHYNNIVTTSKFKKLLYLFLDLNNFYYFVYTLYKHKVCFYSTFR